MEDEENECKPEAGYRHPNFKAVAFFQFLHLPGLSDPEVDLDAVLANHLQLDVLDVLSGHLEFYSW